MRLLVALLIAAAPTTVALLLAGGYRTTHPQQYPLVVSLELAACAVVFTVLYLLVLARCEYAQAYWGALVGALIGIPVGAVVAFILAGVAVSFTDKNEPPMWLLLPAAILALSAPLALGAWIGAGIGNSRGERGPY